MTQLTLDGWYSQITGQGTPDYDKLTSYQYGGQRSLDKVTISALFRDDAVAREIIVAVPHDAMAAGWSISGPPQSILDDVAKEERRLRLTQNVTKWWVQGRAVGGSALILGDEDSQQDTPVDPATPLAYLYVLPRYYAVPQRWGSDPTEPETFARPSTWTLYPRRSVAGGTQVVHASRLIAYEPPKLDIIDNATVWGDSILTTVITQLRNWRIAVDGAAAAVPELSVVVHTIPNLAQKTGTEAGRAQIIGRLQVENLLKSNFRALVKGVGEDISRLGMDFKSLPELIDKFAIDLAAAARMPLVRLFGISPGGFGTGEAENTNWIQHVGGEAAQYLLTTLQRLYSRILLSLGYTGPFKIELGNLTVLTYQQRIDAYKSIVETDSKLTDTAGEPAHTFRPAPI